MKPDLLQRIVTALETDATNYSIFLAAYDVMPERTEDPEDMIRRTCGEQAVVAGLESVGGAAVWAEIEEALTYRGDPGSGASAAVLEAGEFAALLEELKGEVGRMAGDAAKVMRFRLEEGHPAYPVFWDFAFLFQREHGGTILIGASSD